MERSFKLIKGTVISIVIFAVMSLLAGLLLAVTGLPERYGSVYLMITFSIACAFMGLYVGNLFGRNGLLSGIVFSAVFLGIVLIVVSLCFRAFISTEALTFQYLIPLSFGGIFGIIGTNLKN